MSHNKWIRAICSLIFGIGWGLLFSTALLLTGDFSGGFGGFAAMIVIVPSGFALGVVLGIILWIFIARKLTILPSGKLVLAAILGGLLLACIPSGIQVIRLYAIAYLQIPTYPDAEWRTTDVEVFDNSFVVNVGTSASEEQILKFYRDELIRRGWSADYPEDEMNALGGRSILHLLFWSKQLDSVRLGVAEYAGFNQLTATWHTAGLPLH